MHRYGKSCSLYDSRRLDEKYSSRDNTRSGVPKSVVVNIYFVKSIECSLREM